MPEPLRRPMPFAVGVPGPLRRPMPLAVALITLLAAPPAADLAVAADRAITVGHFQRVRLEARGGQLTLAGASNGRYADAVEMLIGPDGPVLVNDLPLEVYLEGVAEMPLGWPLEALKAQAVAARTYAWYEARRGAYTGYDICATVTCQVFRGREPSERPLQQRWRRAVAETAGEVLVDGSAPILARYSSSSGGSTRDNQNVFPEGGAHPYLRAVADPEDAVSPWHRWQVRFTRQEMNAVLAAIPRLRPVTPVVRWQLLPASGGWADRLRLSRADGVVVEVAALEFRRLVSEVAPRRFPGRFPTLAASGRRLPMTLPSPRFDLTVTERELIFDGGGYGHGVGMSQYGALGKARRGWSYRQILAVYYQGLRPRRSSGLPARLRVGLAVGSGEVSVEADRPMRVVVDGQLVTRSGLGTWRVTPDGGRVQLTAPRGYGLPLAVRATTVSDRQPTEVEVIRLATAVNKPATLSLVVRTPAGAELLRRRLGARPAGTHHASWDLDGPGGRSLPSGRYHVVLEAVDETGERAGRAARLDVRPIVARPGASLLSPVPPPPGRSFRVLLVAVALGALVGGAVAGRVEVGR